jgi:hypothetical protein
MNRKIATLGCFALAFVPPSTIHATAADRPQVEFRQQTGVAAAPSPTTRRQAGFPLPAIEAAVRAAGVTVVDKKVLPSGNVIYAIQLAGLKFGLIAYGVDDGNTANSLELSAAFSNERGSERAEQIAAANKWNLERRFVKAYVMDGGSNDIMLEMDLVACGAIEPREVVRTIRDEWMFSLMQWATRTH